MSNRWCILTAPRSGSTYLEASIENAFVGSDIEMKHLGELYHGQQGTIVQDGKFHHYQKNILYNDPRRVSFRNYIFELIKNKPAIGFTLRIFAELWAVKEFKTIDQIQYLVDNGFKIIVLERDIIDSTISLEAALHSDKWHSHINHDGERIEFGEIIKPFEINIETAIINLIKLHSESIYLRRLAEKFEHIHLKYETIEHDARINNLPFKRSSHTFTYDRPYEQIISNYHELKQTLTEFKDKL